MTAIEPVPVRKRRNFSPATIKARLAHCGSRCEGNLDDGTKCPTIVRRGHFHGDHDTPDQMGGEPTFENCRILCIPCHVRKTAQDAAVIAKAKRVEAKHIGAARPVTTALAGRTREEKRAAKAPIKPSLPPHRLYEAVR